MLGLIAQRATSGLLEFPKVALTEAASDLLRVLKERNCGLLRVLDGASCATFRVVVVSSIVVDICGDCRVSVRRQTS